MSRLYDAANLAVAAIAVPPNERNAGLPATFVKLEAEQTSATDGRIAVTMKTPKGSKPDAAEFAHALFIRADDAEWLAERVPAGDTDEERSVKAYEDHHPDDEAKRVLVAEFPDKTEAMIELPAVQLELPNTTAGSAPKGKPRVSIVVNAQQIHDVAKIMNYALLDRSQKNIVQIDFYPDRYGKPQPIVVTSPTDSGAAERFIAIVAPVDIQKEKNVKGEEPADDAPKKEAAPKAASGKKGAKKVAAKKASGGKKPKQGSGVRAGKKKAAKASGNGTPIAVAGEHNCEVCGCSESAACPGGCAWDAEHIALNRYVCTTRGCIATAKGRDLAKIGQGEAAAP